MNTEKTKSMATGNKARERTQSGHVRGMGANSLLCTESEKFPTGTELCMSKMCERG